LVSPQSHDGGQGKRVEAKAEDVANTNGMRPRAIPRPKKFPEAKI